MEQLAIGGMPIEVCDRREEEIRKWMCDPTKWDVPWPGFVEIHKLEGMLIEAEIPYRKIVKNGGWLIYYDNKDGGMTGDAIEHTGSYGNANDLLEVAGFGLEDVEGWLTAREAFEYFKRCHDSRKTD